jgi:hypothetical protein
LLAFGATLMVLMIFRPQGLWPARRSPRDSDMGAPTLMTEGAAKK